MRLSLTNKAQTLFSKPKMGKEEAKWLEKIGKLGVSFITSKPRKIHVLGDVHSRVPNVECVVNDI